MDYFHESILHKVDKVKVTVTVTIKMVGMIMIHSIHVAVSQYDST